MTRGRPKNYENPIAISLRCEQFYRDAMRALNKTDAEVYVKGALSFIQENEEDLDIDHLQVLIHDKRTEMLNMANQIENLERVIIQAGLRAKERKKAKTVTLCDDRGNQFVVVDAE